MTGNGPFPYANLTSERLERWERWFPYVPFVVLLGSAAIAAVTAPIFGLGSPTWLLVQGILVLVTAAWSWWWTIRRPEWRADRDRMRIHVLGRTLLALMLTWINPFFALFAWVGFVDVPEVFGGWQRRLMLLLVSATLAGSQSGGLPPDDLAQAFVFGVLIVVNVGLVSFFSRIAAETLRISEEQAAMIVELERVNADLERAMAQNAHLHETVVAQARAAGVQEERQRLAREIHDTIAQTLAATLAQLQAAEAEPDPRPRLVRVTALTREALSDARRSVMDLAPAPLADCGLSEALTALVSSWDRQHPVDTSLTVTGEARSLHPEVEATVLRIAQEALSNVARHAGATRVGITLNYGDTELLLDVRDDGSGFDLSRRTQPTSFGLRGMRQRAERLTGALEVETRPGSGTALSLRLPALDREAAA